MTAKKSPKRKAPSAAELKRQKDAEKLRADDAEARLEAQSTEMSELKAMVGQLGGQVQRMLDQAPTEQELLAAHDPSKRVAEEVLREEYSDGLPEKPAMELPERIRKQAAALQSKMAKHNPVELRETLETDDRDIGQFEPREMSSEGPARESLAPSVAVDGDVVIENIKQWSASKLEMEMFMHEPVCIRIHDTTDDTIAPIPYVCNKGRNQYMPRNIPIWVKRKFVEPLARAKRTTYTQEMVKNGGIDTYINIPHTALLYPFEVLEDSNKGKAWVRGILAEPN